MASINTFERKDNKISIEGWWELVRSCWRTRSVGFINQHCI